MQAVTPTVQSNKHWDLSWQSRLMEARCTACRYPGIQVGPLTRLSSWSPLVCEPLLWDQAA